MPRSWQRLLALSGVVDYGASDVEYATLEWVDWFNHRRLFEGHSQIPPAEYEETLR